MGKLMKKKKLDNEMLDAVSKPWRNPDIEV